MMTGAPKFQENGFSLLEQLGALAILVSAVVVGAHLLVNMQIKKSFLETRQYGINLGIRNLEEKWSQPLTSLTNSPISWNTNAVYRNGDVKVNVQSVIGSNQVQITSTIISRCVDFEGTNRFSATRFF